MKKHLFLCSLLFLSLVGFAQEPILKFEHTEHDFGTIQEADGEVTVMFKFANTGTAPLVINRVQASCGCTTPTWEQRPIEPGASGMIAVTYDPYARPGKFAKSIVVYSNATQAQTLLQIKGDVIPQKVDFNKRYAIRIAKVGLQTSTVQFNNIKKGTVAYRIVEIMNFDDKPIVLTFRNPYKYIRYGPEELTLLPQQVSKLYMRIESAHCRELGAIDKDIELVLNGVPSKFKLRISAHIMEATSDK